jgi:hypothetical protein
MKIGLGLMLGGLFAFAVGHGCGGGSPSAGVNLDMCLQQGKWVGSGSCGVASFDVSMLTTAGEVTLTDFGDNPSATFTADSRHTKLTDDGLVILTKSGHTCTLSCTSDETMALHCTNASGGKCDSTFHPDVSAP